MLVETKYDVYFIHNMYYERLSELPTKYIFDSNIVADLERFYYRPEKLSKEQKIKLSELISFFREKSVDYSYALTELSSNYKDGGIIDDYYRSANKAVSMLLKMSPSKLRGHTRFGKNKERNLTFQSQTEFGPPSKIIKLTLPLLGQAYTPLAKLFYELKLNSSNKIKVFSNFLHFMDEELCELGLYEVGFATYLLFTNQDELKYVQSLLKVNNKIEISKKIWNASWDITFLRYINSIAGRVMSEEDVGSRRANWILVTRDKALGELSNLLKSDAEQSHCGKIASNLIIDTQQIKPQYLAQYMNIYDSIMSEESLNRRISFLSTCDPMAHNDSIISKADNLINQLYSLNSE